MKSFVGVKSAIGLILGLTIVNGHLNGKIQKRSNPTTNSSAVSRISEQKCDEYIQEFNATNCKTTDALSIDISKVDIRDFPHMVMLGYLWKNQTIWHCDGSLISEFYVLFPAFCSWNSIIGSPTIVKLGAQAYSDENNSNSIVVPVEKIIKHPKYEAPKSYNVMALLKLAKKIKFNDYMRPACLNTEKQLEGKTLIATAWPRIEELMDRSLVQTKLKLLNKKECERTIPKNENWQNGLTEDQFCASEPVVDSSMFYFIVQNTLPTSYCLSNLVGISNFRANIDSSDASAVYTSVSYYLDWIENEVWSST